MKVAAYQARLPLPLAGSSDARDRIARQVERCEQEGVGLLCCPEAFLGGLADNAIDPREVAIPLEEVAELASLSRRGVAIIVGFTEASADGKLYNTAAILSDGALLGCYRKMFPAIRQSVYSAGDSPRAFQIAGMCFGVLICNDSNHPTVSSAAAGLGASVLFIPTNNLLLPARADVIEDVRRVDSSIAREHGVWIVRADVAGELEGRLSMGSSAITDPTGSVVVSAGRFEESLVMAEIDPNPQPNRESP